MNKNQNTVMLNNEPYKAVNPDQIPNKNKIRGNVMSSPSPPLGAKVHTAPKKSLEEWINDKNHNDTVFNSEDGETYRYHDEVLFRKIKNSTSH